ncbi:MAG: hypothetical protein WDA12_04040 [Bacilli bacterium]
MRKKRKLDYDIKSEVKKAILEAYKEIDLNKSKNSLSNDFIKTPLVWFFRIIGIIFLLTSFMFIGTFVKLLVDNKIIDIWMGFNYFIVILSFFMLSILFSVYFIKIAKELKREFDAQYLLAYFSAIVSLSALVISLVSLFK